MIVHNRACCSTTCVVGLQSVIALMVITFTICFTVIFFLIHNSSATVLNGWIYAIHQRRIIGRIEALRSPYAGRITGSDAILSILSLFRRCKRDRCIPGDFDIAHHVRHSGAYIHIPEAFHWASIPWLASLVYPAEESLMLLRLVLSPLHSLSNTQILHNPNGSSQSSCSRVWSGPPGFLLPVQSYPSRIPRSKHHGLECSGRNHSPKDGCTAFPGESSDGTFFTDRSSRCFVQSGTKQETILLFFFPLSWLVLLFRGAFGCCIGIVAAASLCCYSFPPLHTLERLAGW